MDRLLGLTLALVRLFSIWIVSIVSPELPLAGPWTDVQRVGCALFLLGMGNLFFGLVLLLTSDRVTC